MAWAVMFGLTSRHYPSPIAWCTVLSLAACFLTMLNRVGIVSWMRPSHSHQSVQKRATDPSTTMHLVAALYTVVDCGATCMLNSAQGLSGPVLASHDHHDRGTKFGSRMFGTPRPPNSLGEHTCSQAIRQWPPCTSCHPFQRKPRKIFVAASNVFTGISSAIITCIGIDESVIFRSSRRLAL